MRKTLSLLLLTIRLYGTLHAQKIDLIAAFEYEQCILMPVDSVLNFTDDTFQIKESFANKIDLAVGMNMKGYAYHIAVEVYTCDSASKLRFSKGDLFNFTKQLNEKTSNGTFFFNRPNWQYIPKLLEAYEYSNLPIYEGFVFKITRLPIREAKCLQRNLEVKYGKEP
jgi:hypothetical protein